MALPPSGTLTWAQVAVELGMLSTATLSSNDTLIYTLTGKSAGSTVVFPTDFYGKSLSDTTPDAFTLYDVYNVDFGANCVSNYFMVTGIDAATPISITGGDYSVNGGAWTTTSSNVAYGDWVRVRVLSSSSFNTPVSATLTVGGVSDTFTANTTGLPADTTPDAFVLRDISSKPSMANGLSDVITLTGFNSQTSYTVSPISGTNVSINGGTFVSSNGVINPGDTIQLKRTVPAAGSSQNVILSVGGVSDTFTITGSNTSGQDLLPDAPVFANATNTAVRAYAYSNSVTIGGFWTLANFNLNIGITGGEYRVGNTGPWLSQPSMVAVGNTVVVRTMTSPYASNTNTATLYLGDLSGTLGTNYVTSTFSANTAAPGFDTTPSSVTLGSVSNANMAATYVSNIVYLSGTTSQIPISISNGEYSLNGAGFTSYDGVAVAGDWLQVRTVSSWSQATTTAATLFLGNVVNSYSITTTNAAIDQAPNAFTFRNFTTNRSVTVPSDVIIPTGFNFPAVISISGTGSPSYSINGRQFTSANGVICPGDTLQLSVVTNATSGLTVAPVVTIGGVSSTWTVTSTIFADTSPNTPGYGANRTGLPISTYVYPLTPSYTVSGLGTGVGSTCVATNCSYRVNGGPWLTQQSSVINGDVIEARVLTSSSYNTVVNMNLLVGDKSDDVSFTTIAANDSTPKSFGWGTDFVDQENTDYESGIVTVEEISVPVTASISGTSIYYAFRVLPLGGSWDSYSTASRTVNVGDQIQVVMRSGTTGETVTASVQVGSVTGTYSLTISGA